jgi:hypothetical protein
MFPQYFTILFVGYASFVLAFYSGITLLFAGRLPRGAFGTQVWFQRWIANFSAYTLLLRDRHPPFSGDRGLYPVTFEVEEPAHLSRWLWLVKWILAIPHTLILAFLGICAVVVLFIAWFAILFTGRFPRSLFNFLVGVHRWQLRVNLYASLLLTDRYPPFSLD